MWFKYLVKVVCLLRLFNFTLVFFPLRLSFEESMGIWVSCTSYTFARSLFAKTVCLSPRVGREPLLMLLKIELFCRSITLQHIVYLLLLPLCARFKVYAIKIFNFGFLKCSCVASQGCVIPGVLHYSRVNLQPLNISTRTLQYMSSSDNIYAWLVSALM